MGKKIKAILTLTLALILALGIPAASWAEAEGATPEDAAPETEEAAETEYPDELKEAFKSVDLHNVSPKLRLQLFFMKYRFVNIVNMLIVRRSKNA